MSADTAAEKLGKLWELIADIKVAMLATVDEDILRSRPMAAQIDREGGSIWFFTRLSAHKVDEIDREHRVNLSFVDQDASEFVSVSGIATLSRDKARIDELWSPFVAAWFPDGKDDPDVALLRVRPVAAEYWDGPSSRMMQLFKIAAANIQNETPDMGENEKISSFG